MTTVDHIGIEVADLAAARGFFGGILGLRVAYEWKNTELGIESVFYEIGDSMLEVSQHGGTAEAAERLGGKGGLLGHIAIGVQNLDGLVEDWRALGLSFEQDEPRTTTRPTGVQKDIFLAAPGATGDIRYQLVERIAEA